MSTNYKESEIEPGVLSDTKAFAIVKKDMQRRQAFRSKHPGSCLSRTLGQPGKHEAKPRKNTYRFGSHLIAYFFSKDARRITWNSFACGVPVWRLGLEAALVVCLLSSVLAHINTRNAPATNRHTTISTGVAPGWTTLAASRTHENLALSSAQETIAALGAEKNRLALALAEKERRLAEAQNTIRFLRAENKSLASRTIGISSNPQVSIQGSLFDDSNRISADVDFLKK